MQGDAVEWDRNGLVLELNLKGCADLACDCVIGAFADLSSYDGPAAIEDRLLSEWGDDGRGFSVCRASDQASSESNMPNETL